MSNEAVKTNDSSDKIFNSVYISCLVAYFVFQFAQCIVQSIYSKFVHTFVDAGTLLGVATSIYAFAALLTRLIAGPAMEAISKKKLVILAAGFLMIIYAGYGLSANLLSATVFRTLQGIGQALGSGCFLAIVGECVPTKKLAQAVAYFSLAQVFVNFVCPTVAIYMVEYLGYRITFFASAVIMAISFAIAFRIKYTNRTEGNKVKVSFKTIIAPGTLLPLWFMIVCMGASQAVGQWIQVFGEEVGLTLQVGWYISISNLVLFVFRPIASNLYDRFGCVKVMIPQMIIFAVSYYVLATVHTTGLVGLMLSCVLYGAGYGTMQPIIQAMMMKMVSKEHRGVAANTSFIGTDLGSWLGPIVAGWMVGQFGYYGMYNWMTIFMWISVVLLIINGKKITAKEAEYAEE